MRFSGIFTVILFSGQARIFAQAVGDYGSAAAGPANWNAAANWVVCVANGSWAGATPAAAVPGPGTNVWIRAGNTITMNGNPGQANNLYVQGTLVNASNNRALTVAGNLDCIGTINYGGSSGTSSITVTGNLTNTGIITLNTANLTVSGTSAFSSGSFTDNGNNGINTFGGLVTVSGAGVWTTTAVTNNTNMLFNGGLTHSVGSTGAVGVGAATITGNLTNEDGAFNKSANGAFSVSSATNITGGTFTISNNNNPCTFTGLITLSNAAIWTSTAVTTAGNLVIQNGITHNSSGAFSAGGATINTTSGQAIQVNSTGSISFGSGNGNVAVNANMTIQGNGAGNFNYNGTGTMTIAINIVVTNQRSVNFLGALTGGNGASTWLNDVNSTLNYGNSATGLMATGTLTASASGNTVNFNSAGNQTIKAANYYNLTTAAGARTVTLANGGTIGIANTFSPGVVTAYTVANNTVDYNGDANQSIIGNSPTFLAYNNLTISVPNGSGSNRTKTITGIGVQVNGNLVVQSNDATNTCTLDPAGFSLSVNGTTTVNSRGLFTDSDDAGICTFTGSVTLAGNGSFTTSNTTIGNLVIRGGISQGSTANFTTGTLTLGGTQGISGAGTGSVNFGDVIIGNAFVISNQRTTNILSSLNGSNGTSNWTNANNSTLNYAGAGTPMATGLFTVNTATNTVNYSGTDQIVRGTTYSNIIVSGGGSKSLQGAVIVNGTLTLTNGLLTLGAFNLTLATGATLAGTPGVSAMVVTDGAGQFVKTRAVNSGSFTYPIGDNTAVAEYTPVTLNFSANAAGTLGVNVVDNVHPSNGFAPNYLSRYWHFTTGMATYTYTATFNYQAGDVTGSESSMLLNYWNGSLWNEIAGTTAGGNTITLSSGLTQVTGALNGSDITALSNPTNLFYRSKVSGNWNAVSTWEVSTDPLFTSPAPIAASLIPTDANSLGILVKAGDNVTVTAGTTADDLVINGTLTINAGQTFTVANGAAVNDLTVGSTGIVSNAGSLTLTGAVNFNGTYTHAQNGGTIPVLVWNPGSTCNITGYTGTVPTNLYQSYSNFTFASAAVLTLTAPFNVGGNLTISAGTIAAVAQTINLSGVLTGAGTLTFTTGTLNIGGNNTHSGTFTQGTGTVNYNGAGQLVRGITYNNLTLSGTGIKTLNTGPAIVNATYTNSQPAVTLACGNNNITFNSTVNNSGLLTTGTNTVTYAGTGAQGIIAANYNNLTTTGARTGNSITYPNGATVGIAGVFSSAATFTGLGKNVTTGSTIDYNGAGDQNVTNSVTFVYNNLSTSNGGIKTASGSYSITGNLNVGTGSTLSLGSSAATWNITGNATIGGILDFGTAVAKTVNLSGDLTDAGGTVTMTGVLAHILNLNGVNNAISVLTTTAGSGSTVSYNRPGNQQVFGSSTYQNLTVANGSTKSLQGPATIAGILNLASGVLQIGDNNLTISNDAAGAITGTFGISAMIATDGTGYVSKNGTSMQFLYPIGSNTFYSPATLNISAGGTAGTLNIRAVPTTALGTGSIAKYWDVYTSTGGKTITATFTYSPSEGGLATSVWYKGAGAWQTPPPAPATVTLGGYSATVTGTTSITTASTLWSIGVPNAYYSYQSGSWNDPSTWTSDPGGTTQVGVTIPGNNDFVVILAGRTVTLPANIVTANLNVTISEGGFLDLSTFQFNSSFAELNGQGTLKIASSYFPTVTLNNFVNTDGGTTEYYNAVNYDLPLQATYNHLTIDKSGATATQVSNIVLNGNLLVKNGTFQVNNTISRLLQLTINGNVTVNASGSISVGTGVTNTTTDPTSISGGVAPFIDYYDSQSHRIVLKGDFTNNGTVRFTNLTYPIYNLFPPTSTGLTSGFATVYFQGATDNTLRCNGTTDFYNLVLDKGIDQTFKLTVYSTAYNRFRLFGANIMGGESGGNNPNLKKALWIRTGTLVLQGLTIIPSLTEGTGLGSPNSDFYIPANGALELDGPEVVVLSTADDYREVNVAYGVSGGTGQVNGVVNNGGAQSFSIYGRFEMNDGYFSTRESGGFIFWSNASGQMIVNGGTIDTKQIRSAGGASGLASYVQTGGSLLMRGTFQRTPAQYTTVSDLVNAPVNTTRAFNGISGLYGTFNINDPANVFAMSGGSIRIYEVCSNSAGLCLAWDVRSAANNINVTGGTVEFMPTNGSGGNPALHLIYTTAPFYNMTITRAAANNASVQFNTNAVTVLHDLIIQNGILDANNLDLTVGGNFNLANNNTNYLAGTNQTILNGSSDQSFFINTTAALSLNNLKIDKLSTLSLNLQGTQKTINVAGLLTLNKAQLIDNGATINVSGNIYNSGTISGTGKLALAGTTPQVIDGDGNGSFQNLELNNTNAAAAPVSLSANITVTGALTFSRDKLFNIGTNELALTAAATIVNGGAARYIQSSGTAGDGGIKRFYSAGSPTFTFPIGAATSVPANAVKYTPATIAINGAATTYGYISVIPVGYEHPATRINNFSLTYFWRVKSGGFTLGAATVTHGYNYGQADVPVAGVSENEFVAARYHAPSYSWTTGAANDVDETNNIIGEPGPGSFLQNVDFIDGDYTAGDNVGQNPFDVPAMYYSRQDGPWSSPATWSLTDHTTDDPPAVSPGIDDIVIIGNGNTVNLTANASCASLQIEAGSVLDIYTWSTVASNFGMVINHPGGNGLFRLTTTVGSPKLFTFPRGDFSDFNVNGGTTEFYDIDGTVGAVYILPANVTSYGNLILTAKGGDNLILPNNSYTTIKGDLTCTGDMPTAWVTMSWLTAGFYTPVLEKTVHVTGNMYINNGTFLFLDDQAPQHLIVDGDVTIAPTAIFDVYNNYPVNNGAAPRLNSFEIGGSLINNSNVNPSARFINGNNYVNLIFSGSENDSIKNSIPGATPTIIFNKVSVNKGTSQATTLTCNIGGTISTPGNNWLTLQNGTFRYERTGDLAISTTTPFTIPASAGLYINTPSDVNIANNNATDLNDLFLNGKLTIVNGRVFVGTEGGIDNFNNDIEYSGGGNSEIDVQGGTLFVNGQIRRNPATSTGVLKYAQSGSSAVIINGRNANANCAKLEVFNAGSSFSMNNTSTLTIVRGGGGNTYGDLYLRPESGNVAGGTIIFTQTPSLGAVADQVQNYQLDATIPLNNLTITGKTAATARNATVKLMINPLVLNGNLSLSNANSIFDANSTFNINLTVRGNLDNNGTYNHFNNSTLFSGGVQSITGTSAIDFYNLIVNPVTSLTINGNTTVNKNLTLSGGTLICNAYQVTVKGNVTNNATYTDNNGGIVLTGGVVEHHIGGTGMFGQLQLNDALGAKMDNDITLQKDFVLTLGILDINQYLLTLGQNSNISGSGFSATKMITSNGVYSNIGVKKVFGTPLAGTFTFPIGTSGKYTPAVLTVISNGSVGSIRLNNINSTHPGVLDPTNVLSYFWEVESSGISGFNGSLQLSYLPTDVVGGPESNYVAARLINPGTSWSKAAPGPGTDNVDEINHRITFNFPAGTNNLSGEYTSGNDAAIPNTVPQFTSNADGNWNNPLIWTQTGGDPYTLTGGPNGFIVTIDDVVTINANYCFSYRTTINNKLRIVSPYFGHNLGSIDGNGTLYLEGPTLPAGRYTSFFDCSSSSTLEYGGSTNYTLVADLYSSIPKLHFTGTGSRFLPNKDLTICKQLLIDGPTLDNTVNNRKLIIQGTIERYNAGAFLSGSGAGATVSLAGSSPQTIGGILGDFSGSNDFNNLEINNPAGITINNNGQIEISNNLLLSNGTIRTTSTNKLSITNAAINCVIPAGGSASSYVNGPLIKKINQGDNFRFPIGMGSDLGNKLTLTSTQTGTLLWTAEYLVPNSTYTDLTAPLSYVNSKEYFTVSTTAGSQAVININWDPLSDLTPLMTQNGLSDMRVARHNTGNSSWEEIASGASGNNNNGTVFTSSRVTIPGTGSDKFSISCINTTKPRASLTPAAPICGAGGIPVTITASIPINFSYILSYKRNGVAQTPVTINSLPYSLPVDATGATYQLTGFSYNNPPYPGPVGTGVVDPGIVTTYTVPTTALAGTDQSICGGTGTTLAGNVPVTGTGLWTITNGNGGTVVQPTVNNSLFNGTNGTAYTLRWTISNGSCSSFEDVIIDFPLLPVQPGSFIASSPQVCRNQNNVAYTIVNDVTVTYSWNYSGTGVVINGTGNSVTLDFDGTATDGTLGVTATNGCGTSLARTLNIVVNPRPVPLLSGTQNVCTDAIAIYSTGAGMTGYTWNVTGGTISAGGTASDATATITWNTIGNQAVEVNYTDANGCSATTATQLPVQVFKKPETGPSFYVPNNFNN